MVPNPDADQWGPHQLLSMAARLVQRRQDQALAELGLTHAAVIALQGLLDGPLNQEQLASDIKVRSQSIGRVLSRLEAAGLVVRESSSLDRRHNEVSITEAGRQALEAARKAEQEALPPDVVGGTVLGRELARVISYFPGRAKAGSTKPQDTSAGGEPGAGENVDGGAMEGGPAVAGVPSEGAPLEGIQQGSGTDTSAEPALQAPVAAEENAAQDAMPAPQDRAGVIPKPHGKGDSAPV
ncbi:MarR family winged helix-turn-helix transcriptional regulator [Arthrobacter sp. NPDC057009]|uniref:MarR family winged helix-turn-helix transcriptional regulator n=1 Tax=Arthrobacter sp. NPDC057009 TaxID=3345996 RepID=UPI0036410A1C